jgi:predicted ATPase
MRSPMKVVLTGGPHAGKTTLLRELAARGQRVVPEAAIEVIAELVRTLGSDAARAWRSEHSDEFQARIAERQVAIEREFEPRNGELCFFDRGVLDGLAYCRLHGRQPPPTLEAAVRGARYDLAVLCELVLPFTSRTETGRTSDERRAREIELLVRDVYREHGFEVLALPLISPASARAERLLAEIAARRTS